VESAKSKVPQHIAIIMDGNGRWAKQRQLSRSEGHVEGVKRVEEVVDYAKDIGVKALTLYTFSTENWRRPETEVASLMNTITVVLHRKVKKLKRDNIRFRMIGSRIGAPDGVLNAMDSVQQATQENTGLCLNLAFNYGSRFEIIEAVRKVAQDVQQGNVQPQDINEDLIEKNLYTYGLPEPDLLIRTSGEKRISNFLLWQLSYAEFYFTEAFWPDFNVEEFKKALLDFENRERRYGDLVSQ
jgi:undecaprenyl diphosphate synthase